MEETQHRTWAEINLSNLEHNYRALRADLPQDCRFLGVVKANAYGHGAVPVARRLASLGAEYLAVACLEEAEELRLAGIQTPILLLGYLPPDCGQALLRYKLTPAVYDMDSARALSAAAVEAGKTITVHVKADTGMTRLGWLCGEAGVEGTAAAIAAVCALPGLYPEGIFTHFSDADTSEAYTLEQFTRFLNLLDALEARGLTFPIRHCAASAAVLHYPCTHLDMVRPGIALYGHFPAPSCEGLLGAELRPVMTLKTRVASVKTVPAGTPVSYGRTHILRRDSRLAVLTIGYADGLPRLCSDQLEVLLCGQRVPVLGRICMDMCMVDVTDLPAVQPGDVAEIYGAHIPVEELARRVGTIQYELLCAVSARVPRVYLG